MTKTSNVVFDIWSDGSISLSTDEKEECVEFSGVGDFEGFIEACVLFRDQIVAGTNGTPWPDNVKKFLQSVRPS